jgi:molybdate transport system substrate-binding protein
MKASLLLLLILCCLMVWSAPAWSESQTLLAYSSDSIQPAMDEAAQAFQKKTGIEVKVNYCKQKQAFQWAKEQNGDLFFSGHGNAVDNAKKEGLISTDTPVSVIGYLQIVLAVPKDNPQKIAVLEDLTKPGLKVGLGDPNSSQLGQVSEELLQKVNLTEAVHNNVVARGDCCSKVLGLLTDGKVEAALGWADFSRWKPEQVKTITLPAELAQPLPVSAMVFNTSEKPEAAKRFIDFLLSRKGKAIFKKYGYFPKS